MEEANQNGAHFRKKIFSNIKVPEIKKRVIDKSQYL